jgi:hypothetical protein
MGNIHLGLDKANSYQNLSGFSYLGQLLDYLVFSRIFFTASKIGKLLGSYI